MQVKSNTVMAVSREVLRKMCKVLIIFMFQESKWSFFKKKKKQNTNFENPIYAEVLSISYNSIFQLMYYWTLFLHS